MRRSQSLILILIFCFILSGCSAHSKVNNQTDSVLDSNTALNVQVTELNDVTRTVKQGKSNSNNGDVARAADTSVVTMRDIASFLENKKEHYPLSDEFIEKYQQSSGGYLDTARKNGLEVNKEKHEPNQKWHFFDSWLYPSIDDGTLTWDASAQSRVYSKLLCPELLLWIYEACEVDPVKVKNAKDVAEQGKSAGLTTTTIAKNMRACVSWEDLEKAIVNRPNVVPTNLSASARDLRIYVNGEKNLNDEIQFFFEPENTTDKRIIWSCGENEYFTLSGSTISANKAGSAQVTATSAANNSLFVNITVTVTEPPSHSVSVSAGEGFTVTGLQTEYAAGSVVSFSVNVTDDTKQIAIVTATGATVKSADKKTYNFIMPDNDVTLIITLKDISSGTSVKYNLAGNSTAQIKTDAAALDAFKLVGDGEGIINAITSFNYIYGGGSGGSDENRWSSTEMLKLGTTGNNGSITFSLNAEINRVIITGYVHNNKCEIRVGDGDSEDWKDGTGDGKTTSHICSDMNTVSKTAIDNGQASVIVIDFESSSCITIATVNSTSTKYPLYITSIEFVFNAESAK